MKKKNTQKRRQEERGRKKKKSKDGKTKQRGWTTQNNVSVIILRFSLPGRRVFRGEYLLLYTLLKQKDV